MSYCIEYNPELRKAYPKKREKLPVPSIKLLIICVLAFVGVYILFGTGLLKFLIPGDADVTVTAFSDMVQRVGTGENVSDAVFCFFKDVIGAGLE